MLEIPAAGPVEVDLEVMDDPAPAPKPARRPRPVEDDDEDDRPQRRRKPEKKPAGLSLAMVAGLFGLAVLVIGGIVLYVQTRQKPTDANPELVKQLTQPGPQTQVFGDPVFKPPVTPAGWVTFTDPRNRFSVMMPGPPATIPSQAPEGVSDYLMCEFNDQANGAVYRVGAGRLTVARTPNDTDDQILDRFAPRFRDAVAPELAGDNGSPDKTSNRSCRTFHKEYAPEQPLAVLYVFVIDDTLVWLKLTCENELFAYMREINGYFGGLSIPPADTGPSPPTERPEDWIEFKPGGTGVTVSVPTTPTKGASTVNHGLGPLTVWHADTDTPRYEIRAIKLDQPIAESELKAVFTRELDAYGKSVNLGKPKHRRPVTAGKYRGQQVRFEGGDGKALVRVFATPSHVYLLAAVGSGVEYNNSEVTSFLEPLKIED